MKVVFYKDKRGERPAETRLREARVEVQCMAAHCIERVRKHKSCRGIPWCNHVIGTLRELYVNKHLIVYAALWRERLIVLDAARSADRAMRLKARHNALYCYYQLIKKEGFYGRQQHSAAKTQD